MRARGRYEWSGSNATDGAGGRALPDRTLETTPPPLTRQRKNCGATGMAQVRRDSGRGVPGVSVRGNDRREAGHNAAVMTAAIGARSVKKKPRTYVRGSEVCAGL